MLGVAAVGRYQGIVTVDAAAINLVVSVANLVICVAVLVLAVAVIVIRVLD